MKIVVTTPERRVLEDDCESASLPSSSGYVTLLPNHAPLISLLGTGQLSYETGGKTARLAVSGGFFEVSDAVVTVLTSLAEQPDEIDADDARKELEAGKTAMASGIAGKELVRARRQLERAEARLMVVDN